MCPGRKIIFEIGNVYLHVEINSAFGISDIELVGKTMCVSGGILSCIRRLATLCKKVIMRFAIYEGELFYIGLCNKAKFAI